MNHTARFIAHHTLCDLDLTHPEITHALLDPQEMHRMVMRAFRHWVPDGQPDARAHMGILHTYAANLATQTLTLIIQSRVPGDWHTLPSTALTAPPDTQTIDLTLREGDDYRFRTVVNPARYQPGKVERSTRDRPADAAPPRALEWFTARLQPHGTPNYDRFRKIGADSDSTTLKASPLPSLTSKTAHIGMRINRAEIRGQLTITDPAAFAQTLAQGMGRSRAFGCGLLLTQPIRVNKEQSRPRRPVQEGSAPRARG